MYYKVLYLPEASFLQSLVNKKDRREGTVDTIFETKEEAQERLRVKLVYETEVLDIDNPMFLFFHYEIQEFEGEPPENPIVYNKIPKKEIDDTDLKAFLATYNVKIV